MSRNTLLNIEVFTPGNDIDIHGQWKDFEQQPQVWCEVLALTGREFIQAQQTQSNVTHRIRTERVAGVNNQMRLVQKVVDAEGEAAIIRKFNVISVVDMEEKHRELEWMVSEDNPK